jgi:hypothetical protein
MTKTICLAIIALAVIAAQVSWNRQARDTDGLIRSSHVTIQCPPQCTLTVLEAGMVLGAKPITPAGASAGSGLPQNRRKVVEIDLP